MKKNSFIALIIACASLPTVQYIIFACCLTSASCCIAANNDDDDDDDDDDKPPPPPPTDFTLSTDEQNAIGGQNGEKSLKDFLKEGDNITTFSGFLVNMLQKNEDYKSIKQNLLQSLNPSNKNYEKNKKTLTSILGMADKEKYLKWLIENKTIDILNEENRKASLGIEKMETSTSGQKWKKQRGPVNTEDIQIKSIERILRQIDKELKNEKINDKEKQKLTSQKKELEDTLKELKSKKKTNGGTKKTKKPTPLQKKELAQQQALNRFAQALSDLA